MISIWANFNAQSFIHPKLSMQSSELFLYVSTCLQQQCIPFQNVLSVPYMCGRGLTVHMTTVSLNDSQ